MIVEIKVEGTERLFVTDYHTLHSRNWNDVVRDMLDDAQDLEEGKIKSDE